MVSGCPLAACGLIAACSDHVFFRLSWAVFSYLERSRCVPVCVASLRCLFSECFSWRLAWFSLLPRVCLAAVSRRLLGLLRVLLGSRLSPPWAAAVAAAPAG